METNMEEGEGKLKKGVENNRNEIYEQKELHCDKYRREVQECHLWL